MNRWLTVSFMVATLSWAGSLYVWRHLDLLPAQVPTHWDINDQPNQFTPREAMLPQLLLFPGILTGLVLLTLALPWLSPQPFSLDEWRPTYDYVMALTTVLLGYIHWVILAGWLGMTRDPGRWLLGGLFLFFA